MSFGTGTRHPKDVLDFTGTTDPQRDLHASVEAHPRARLQDHSAARARHSQRVAQRRLSRHGCSSDPSTTCRCTTYSKGAIPRPQRCRTRTPTPPAQSGSRNATHLSFAASWLHDVLRAVEPYSHDVIAIALDDDQGAYLDNDTWPAPHWHAYIDWLRSTVQSVTGSRIPLFVNTYEMKVPAASPVWAWGNWYQSNSYTYRRARSRGFGFCHRALANATARAGDAVGVSSRLVSERRRRRSTPKRSVEHDACIE